jgi:hypothetical protein
MLRRRLKEKGELKVQEGGLVKELVLICNFYLIYAM